MFESVCVHGDGGLEDAMQTFRYCLQDPPEAVVTPEAFNARLHPVCAARRLFRHRPGTLSVKPEINTLALKSSYSPHFLQASKHEGTQLQNFENNTFFCFPVCDSLFNTRCWIFIHSLF